jgi:hypothetical protein
MQTFRADVQEQTPILCNRRRDLHRSLDAIVTGITSMGLVVGENGVNLGPWSAYRYRQAKRQSDHTSLREIQPPSGPQNRHSAYQTKIHHPWYCKILYSTHTYFIQSKLL